MSQENPERGLEDDNRNQVAGLTAGFCNGTLSDEESARLEQLLLGSAAAREYFRRYLALDAALRDYGGSAATHWSPTLPPQKEPAAKRSGRWPWWIGGTIAVLGILGLAAVYMMPRSPEAALGTLEQITGDVRLFAASGKARSIAADAPLRAGDTVRTRGSESSTIVAYPDGTRLTLLGNTSVTYGDGQAKSLVVHEGTLAASVSRQPSRMPMLIATPLAQMEVLGTQFFVEALAGRTDLSVTEGRVRLVRIRDGESVEVPNGKHAVVTEQSQLVVQDIPSQKAAWETDFEAGLPEGWINGEHVTEGLPSGSRGGVKTARFEHPDGAIDYAIVTNDEWLSGLFTIEAKSHLHFTFKLQRTHWFNVLLVTRTSDPRDPRFSGNYIFNELRGLEQDRWYSATIPLALFNRIHRGEVPVTEVIPFRLSFGSDQSNLHLVIDRMWVTPDGSGEVELKPVE
jgi:ferric-dicitrate binding protein FerR (iron transport regulator)